MATKTTRSTLVNHCIPSFYACYLLRSIRTPKSTATYIGSTPSPPRRIRQHNGEITQGARRTERNRPWVMQMLVHGFPSKLAALQFEWAWQHPHISRHLRNRNGKTKFAQSNLLLHRIQVAHGMVRSHPYNTWALHVKLFTAEAAKVWDGLSRKAPLLPGFTSIVELEGVDGKSGKTGSGRTGPIDVTDAQFTASHLHKAHSLTGSHRCSVCKEPITDFRSNALDTALCSTSGCKAVSHLACLASSFTSASGSFSSSSTAPLIPRGGTCASCKTYVLWGDVIRGCYRVHKGGAVALPEDAEDEMAEEDEDTDADADSDAMDVDDERDIPVRKGKGKEVVKVKKVTKPKGRPRKVAATTEPKPKQPRAKRTKAQAPVSEEEGEFFDLDNISSSDSEGSDVPPYQPAPKKRGRPPKAAQAASSPGPSPSASPAKKRGRPREHTEDVAKPARPAAAVPESPQPGKRGRPKKRPVEVDFFDLKSDRELEDALSGLSISSPNLSEMEQELLGPALRGQATKADVRVKRGRGRPRKADYIEISD